MVISYTSCVWYSKLLVSWLCWMSYRINWCRHPDRRGQVFLPYTKMTRDMRIALPCNIAEPCGWAFRQNTGCHKASLLVGTIISMNYQYEELQLIELLRQGKAISSIPIYNSKNDINMRILCHILCLYCFIYYVNTLSYTMYTLCHIQCIHSTTYCVYTLSYTT